MRKYSWVLVIAALATSAAADAPKVECLLLKSVKVSIRKSGTSSWETVAAGTRVEIVARGTPWTDVIVPQGRGKVSTSVLDGACASAALPVDAAPVPAAVPEVDTAPAAPIAAAEPVAAVAAVAPVPVVAPVAPSEVIPAPASGPLEPSAPAAPEVAATRAMRNVAVLELKAEGEGAAPIANALGAVITSAVSTRPGFVAVSRHELKALLAHTADASLLGCQSLNCMTDIAKLADAERIVSGSVGRVEGTDAAWLITLSLIDPSVPAILERANATWRGPAVEIVTTIPPLLDRLFDGAAAASYLGGLEVFAPDGVTVSVDGREVGKTPLRGPLRDLPIGVHTVVVSGQGYVSSQADVVISRSDISVVRLELEEEPYWTQWWFWTAVGGGSAVAVAGGVAAALLLSEPPPTTIVVKSPLPSSSASAE